MNSNKQFLRILQNATDVSKVQKSGYSPDGAQWPFFPRKLESATHLQPIPPNREYTSMIGLLRYTRFFEMLTYLTYVH